MSEPNNTPQPRVSRITIGRLYNMGNYEHTRYEIAVDVPEGADAGDAMRRLKNLLWALRPVRIAKYDYDRAKKLLADPANEGKYMTDLPAATRAAQELVDRYEAEHLRVKNAVEDLRDLAGTREYKDAKWDWEEDY